MASNFFNEGGVSSLADVTSNVNVSARFLDGPLVPYEEASATTNMMDIPRFGHSNQFSDIFDSDDPQKTDDYIEGLFFVGAFTLTVFGIWTLLLLIMKLCCCRKNFLSGRAFTLTNDNDEVEQPPAKDDLERFAKRTKRYRIVFLIAGTFLILCSILLVNQGFKNIEATRSTADHSLDDIRMLIDEATRLTEDLRGVGANAMQLRDQLLVELSKDKLCPNDPNYLIQDEIGKQINENSDQAIEMLNVLGDFTTNQIEQLEDGLTNADMAVDDIDVVVEAAADKQWIGMLFAVPLVFLAATMMAATMAAQAGVMTDCAELCLSYFIQPWFLLWIVTGYVLCAAFALAATTNADFCAGGTDQTPDGTILQSLRNGGHAETDTVYEVTRYYVKQCTAEAKVDPFLFMRGYAAEIDYANGIVQDLADTIASLNVEDLSFQCGRDFEPLRSSLDTMMEILNTLARSANSGLGLLSCERIVPIYTDIVYDGTCNTSVTGLAWIFSCLLIISTMGMIMLTLRASYKNNVIQEEIMDHTDEDSEVRAMRSLALRNANNRKKESNNHHHDLYLEQEHQWKSAALRQRTSSDSDSVYTSNNYHNDDDLPPKTGDGGEWNVKEVNPMDLPPHALPTYYDDDGYDYDYGYGFSKTSPPRPTAPRETDLYY